MIIHPKIASLRPAMTAWLRTIHAHPELGFEELRTADLIANKLESWGIEVHRGLAGTGVVGSLRGRWAGSRSIGLRAEMDALPLTENTALDYGSQTPGKMHACGHDGHTAMLLGAAQCLSAARDFAGIVHFIFQPAEEGLGGGERMVREGLFTLFPCDAVYAIHNLPSRNLGYAGLRPGPALASMDLIEIDVKGTGGHAAFPHLAVDPVAVSAHIICALQTLVSRSTDPLQSAVLSITAVNGGTTHNVIPDTVRMLGTARTFSPTVRDCLESGTRRIVTGVAQAMGAEAEIRYLRKFPATVNSPPAVAAAATAARRVFGEDCVSVDMEPIMGAEDFAFMLEAVPGAFVFLGQAGKTGSRMYHTAQYEFNDDLLTVGASFWVSLVEQELQSEDASPN